MLSSQKETRSERCAVHVHASDAIGSAKSDWSRERRPSSRIDPSYTGFGLAKRVVAGDGQAFGELYAKHHSHVHWLCTQMTFDITQADDLTQDIFLKVYMKLDSFRGEASLSTWIHRVAINEILMHLRKTKRQLPELSLDAVVLNEDTNEVGPRQFPVTDTVLTQTIDRIALERAIAHLPIGYRQCLVLHDIEGYQHSEIARMLNYTLGCSKSQLHRARLRIRRMLEGDPEAVCGIRAEVSG